MVVEATFAVQTDCAVALVANRKVRRRVSAKGIPRGKSLGTQKTLNRYCYKVLNAESIQWTMPRVSARDAYC